MDTRWPGRCPVLAYLSRFRDGPICDRLPPVATTLLHKCSIRCRLRGNTAETQANSTPLLLERGRIGLAVAMPAPASWIVGIAREKARRSGGRTTARGWVADRCVVVTSVGANRVEQGVESCRRDTDRGVSCSVVELDLPRLRVVYESAREHGVGYVALALVWGGRP
jgi:hypothetical protein